KTEALWSKDPQLSKIPAKIGLASYPYKVVLNEGKLNVREIIDHPEYAEQRKTRDAIAAIQDVKNFFDPNSEQAWSVLADVAQTAANFKGRGWQEPAAYLDDLAENVKPEPNKPIVESVNAVLELEQQGTLQRIDSSLQEIAGYQQTIARSEDRILAGFDADYVNRELAAAKDIAELGDKLGRMMELGRTAAELIERDWQTNVDREAFLNDHGNDSLEGPTEETFNERLGLIKQYYYLRPDPREEIFGLVSKIELYTEQARVSNPKEAAACVKELGQLQPSVEAIRHVKPLEKNRQQIAQNLTGLKPRLQELKDRAERAIETAEEFVTRMKKLVSIAGSETINMKWITLRDNLFNNYPLPKISRDLELYSETRHRTDSIIANLVVLDNTLRKELPAELGVHLKDKDWNNSLNQIYERERKETIEQLVRDIPLRDELPDVNDTPFQEILRGEFSKFEKWRSDLGGILVAFNEVEARLEVCYLLDDKPSADKDTLRSLWTRWKDTEILKEPTINSAMAEPTNRLRTLEAIEDYSDSQELVVTASRPDSPNEAVYAAWIRLGELSWPIELDELNKDRNIRDKLRLEFETIKRNDDRRGSFLLQSLVAGSLNREANFIERKRAGDKVLGKLVKLAREADCSGAFSECQKLEAGAKELADFVAGEDWQTGKVQRELFFADSKVHKLEGPVSVETSKSWLGEVVDYRQLDTDPRTGYLWGAKIDEINELLSKGLGQSSGLTEEALAKLEQHKTNFAAIVRDIDELRALPAIKKNESEIGPDRCLSLWGQLEEREGEIRSIIKPAYCNRLELDNGRLIFASEYLQPNFEPLSNLEQLKPSLGAVLEEDTDLIQKGKDLAEGVVEGGKKIGEDISEGLRDLFGKKKDEIDKEPVQPALTWEHIRQAINNGEREWLDFFYTIDENETQNLGWPTYMRSTKDQSVVLRFIPAGPGNAEPFYMLTHETTNAQYRLFLEKTGAKNAMTLRGWSRYTDPDNKTLIYSTINDKPPCAITWNRSKSSFEVDKTNADIPVAWVTYHGALSYAKWLGGELPAVSQHKYACRANTSSIPPWGDDRSRLASYAHVRAAPWQKAATEWNEKKDAQVPPLPIAPVGAIKGMAEDKSLPTSDIVVRDSAHESIWPRPVDQAQTPNAWGLYDMIGNVWEWCRDDRNTTESVICGGSCLAPPRYVLLNSETDYQYSFNKRASDVGFRTMALAK
ncbi:MAG: SUMF1/EgtB/PvdO family nonheme iron enzyme, partial [Planctomycetota bacterium]